MAEKQAHRVHEGDRVQIKDTVVHMYPQARAYNQGFVRATSHDEFGYPLIYVEWDKDHWAYSGEQDRWVLEAHFDPVEEKTMADKPNESDLIKALAQIVKQFGGPAESENRDADVEDKREELEDSYDEVLNRAVDDARDGEAFIILVARPEEGFQGGELITPHIYMHSKRDDAALLLDACMADAVAQTYARLVLSTVAQMKRSGDGPVGS